eukprot:m.66281 g.66281  ORF g.66281 m.66281 type:complete len:287 (+) comp23668_c0_seq1:325-1185(+)
MLLTTMWLFDTVAAYYAKSAVKKQVNAMSRQMWSSTSTKSQAPKHAMWDTLLTRYVSTKLIRGIKTAVVDYKGIGNDPQFASYLSFLANLDQEELAKNPAEHLAALINGYNALCINVIASANKNGQLSLEDGSINNLSGYFSLIWKQKVGVFAGQHVSLDSIEHDRIRTIFKDDRVHACLVCASVSCPDLHAKAFEAATLDEVMSARFQAWVLNRAKGVNIVDNKVYLSKIFLWYAIDFEPNGDLLDYISTFDPELKELRATTPDLEVKYTEYDWGVNSLQSKSAV